MEGSAQESLGTQSSWLRCYRCWSQNLEVQLHYEGILKVDPDTGEAVDPVEEVQEAVVQCLDCLHDQPHLSLTFYDEDGRRISRIEPVEDRWERMVTGTPVGRLLHRDGRRRPGRVLLRARRPPSRWRSPPSATTARASSSPTCASTSTRTSAS